MAACKKTGHFLLPPEYHGGQSHKTTIREQILSDDSAKTRGGKKEKDRKTGIPRPAVLLPNGNELAFTDKCHAVFFNANHTNLREQR